jgi:Transposase DDE domain group 1
VRRREGLILVGDEYRIQPAQPGLSAWLMATAVAADLRAWLYRLALDGEEARATPKTLRYRILHIPARLVRGQRRRRLKIPATWPWAETIVQAFRRIQVLPRPA